jgi:hypothetical protein
MLADVRLEVFTAVAIKNAVFWRPDVSKELVFLRSVSRLLVTDNVIPTSPILLTLMIEAGKFLRNVGSYKNHRP